MRERRSGWESRAGRSVRGNAGRALGLLLAFAAPLGCDRGPPQGGEAFGKPAKRIAPAEQEVSLDAPMQSCVRRVLGTARLEEKASVMPLGFRKVPEPQDSTWDPALVRAVVPLGDRLVVLDAGLKQLAILGPDLTLVRRFGREGGGPGELREPMALAVDADLAQIYVLDIGNRRIAVFDTTGAALGTRAGDVPGGVSIAARRDTVFFSHFVMPGAGGRQPARTAMLSALAPAERAASPLVSVADGDRDPGRFPMPGPNTFEVRVSDRYLALFVGASGHVDIYRGGDRVGTVRVCMPPALARAYARQRRAQAGKPRLSQMLYPMLTDVMLRGDTVFTIGPMPDARGRLHVDRYRVDGTDLGSIVIPIGDSAYYPQYLRF